MKKFAPGDEFHNRFHSIHYVKIYCMEDMSDIKKSLFCGGKLLDKF